MKQYGTFNNSMKFIFTKIFILLYSLGTISLPMGNFSALGDLQKMYDHCKATEDNDMSLMDFITDHLINIDSFFDKHQNGDEQKPHKPFEFNINYPIPQFISAFEYFVCNGSNTFVLSYKTKISKYKNIGYTYDIIDSIFRPPIFV